MRILIRFCMQCCSNGHALRRRVTSAVVLLAGALVAASAIAATSIDGVQVRRFTSAHYAETQVVDVLNAEPHTPFEKIARLSVTDPTGTATRAQLTAQLTGVAEKLGASALVIHAAERSGTGGVGFNPAGGQMQSLGSAGPVTLTAVAIRYTHLRPRSP